MSLVLRELENRVIDLATETVLEVLQEGVSIGGTQLGSKLDTGEYAYSFGDVAGRLWDGIGEKYDRPVPTELKLYYDVRTKKFRSEYKYEEVCSARTGKSAGDVFDEWLAEMKGQ